MQRQRSQVRRANGASCVLARDDTSAGASRQRRRRPTRVGCVASSHTFVLAVYISVIQRNDLGSCRQAQRSAGQFSDAEANDACTDCPKGYWQNLTE